MPIEITMPALSPTMTEGNLATWNVKEGDEVNPGDVIAEIETDKATMEVEAVDGGKIGKILVKEGAKQVPVNDVIALLLEDGESEKDLESYTPKKAEEPKEEVKGESKPEDNKSAAPASPAPAPSAAPTKAPTKAPSKAPAPTSAAPATSATTVTKDNEKVPASPVARKLADSYGIELSQIKGSGPNGRVVKEDVEEFLATSNSIVRRNPDEFDSFENSNIRQVIARRLLESKQQVPHFYLNVDCNLDNLLETRKQINANAPKNDGGKPLYKASVNDFVIKASALALKDVPEANASWYDDAIVRYNNVDISVAVATDNGLITPIIFNADQKSILQISSEMKALAKKARDNKLKPEEFQGGGFSISNLGMYGVKQFSAIINPPQSCILAVGAGEERPIVKNGKIEIANIVSLTLSVDHRSVDGAVGALYLQALKKYLENPALMLVK